MRRLDRLISDISDASRLDAELARADMAPVDLARILGTVVAMANHVEQDSIRVTLDIAPNWQNEDGRKKGFMVMGHDSRLGQVFNNLIDNAKSFSKPGGSVRVTLRPAKGAFDNGLPSDGFEIIVDDDGPGIPADAFERIFERFYTDRPCQGFGQNSGLGLSISRQIIEAHGGRIRAMNRLAPGKADGRHVLGARFVVWLRAAKVSAAGPTARQGGPSRSTPAPSSSARRGSSFAAPSGAGKSSLALALDHGGGTRGAVRRGLSATTGSNFAAAAAGSSPAAIRAVHGMIERRGQGILHMAYETAAVVRLVVDILARRGGDALSGGSKDHVTLCGVELPLLGSAQGRSRL